MRVPCLAAAAVFRIFRLFRLLQLERFMTAFTLLDNVFRASASVLKATGLMALIVWLGGAALFFLFERDNPNWRTCDGSVAPCRTRPEPVHHKRHEPATERFMEPSALRLCALR